MVNKKTSKALASKGFTIIEILIVVAIIGILAVGGTIKRKESLQRKQTEMEALKIKQMVELARDHALTGEVITVSGHEFVPHYFQFEIDKDTKEYKINALGADLISLKELESGEISIDNIGVDENATINYKVPYADCTFVPLASSTITICGGDGNCAYNPSNSLNYTIRINDEQINGNDVAGRGSVTIE